MIFHDFYSFVTNILYQQMKFLILKKKKKKKVCSNSLFINGIVLHFYSFNRIVNYITLVE